MAYSIFSHHKHLLFFLLVSALWSSLASFGVQAGSDLFDVEVRVPDESKKVRQAAFTRGLQVVMVRLSGDSQVLNKLTLPPASRFVKQYRYDVVELETVAQLSADRASGQLQLWIQYDAEKLSALLHENLLPVWSQQRDEIVLWLAVRDGFQHYLLKQDDDSIIKKAADDIATERGLSVVWPKMDDRDKQTIRFADVWAGFSRPLEQASRRYASGPILAANLAWNGTGWVSEWTLLDSGKAQRWVFDNADYATVITDAIDTIADELGSRYAVLEDLTMTDQDSIQVELKGVTSVADFKAAERVLKSSPAVQSLQLVEAYSDYVIFKVLLRTNEQDFLLRLNRNNKVRQLIAEAVVVADTDDAAVAADSQGNTGGTAPKQPPPVAATYRYQLLGVNGAR